MPIYWGDLHGHTVLSDGNYDLATGKRDRDDNTPAHHLHFARELAGLDFAAVADHDYALTEEKWAEIVRDANHFNAPGCFTAFAGIEWGHQSGGGQEERIALACGHKVAIWPGDDPPYFDWPNSTLEDFFRLVREHEGVSYMAHPCYYSLSDFERSDPQADVGIAMAFAEDATTYGCEYSGCPGWHHDATSGYTVQEALARGMKLAFVGESDTHHGMPGSGPLVGVHCEELSRQAIVQALRHRQTSATTGARIRFHEFSVNGTPLGGETRADRDRVSVCLRIEGSAPIVGVELLLGHPGATTPFPVVWTERPDRKSVQLETEIRLPQTPCLLYPRVLQADRHFGWASPVWIH
ncbi:MAG: DUF3604 domain-containing protein [Lentisphaeria bacterium]|nr:DUF3604 domain-containing protein [Lentisphaeria bacterium]